MLFVLPLGTVGEASPFVGMGVIRKKAKPEQRWRRSQAQLQKASQVLAAGHGVPKTPAGPDGVSCLQSQSGASCCPEPCLLQGPEIPWCRLTTGRKEFTKNRQQQILAFLLSLSTGRVPLVALPRGLGRLAKPQGEAMPHDC